MAPPHFLVIVRQDRPELLEPLRKEFAASTGTVVFRDRRARPRDSDGADPCWSSGFKVAVSSGRSAGHFATAPAAATPDPSGAGRALCSGPIPPGTAIVAHDGATIHLTCWARELRIRAAQQRARAAQHRDRSMVVIAATSRAVGRARQTTAERPSR